MIAKILFSTLFFVAGIFATLAQTFDGTYLGRVTITKIERSDPRIPPECPPIGKWADAVFVVKGSEIRLRNFVGRVEPDGRFEIIGSENTTGPRPSLVDKRWWGTTRGRVMTGDYVGKGRAGVCYGRISAQRKG